MPNGRDAPHCASLRFPHNCAPHPRFEKAFVQTDSPPVIELRNLHKSFGPLEVLKGVDMLAPRGHVVSLIGSSGSGKSTLLRCCNLLESSQAGDVLFEGEAVRWAGSGAHRHPADRAQLIRMRTNLSMVFQQFNLWSHLTILQNVMEAPLTVLRQPRGEVEERARALLAKVGVGDKAEAYPAQLSGGQQQRVAIARTLALKPKVLLFDEPTSALDPELVGEVLDVIKELASSGITLIIVTHEIGFAREVADRIVFMEQGRVVETGSPAQVLNDPQNRRTADFIAKVL